VGVLAADYGSYGWTVSCHVLLAGIASRIGVPTITDIAAEAVLPMQQCQRDIHASGNGTATQPVADGVFYCQWREPLHANEACARWQAATPADGPSNGAAAAASELRTLVEVSPDVFVELFAGPGGVQDVACHYSRVRGGDNDHAARWDAPTILQCNMTTKGCLYEHKSNRVSPQPCGMRMYLGPEGVTKRFHPGETDAVDTSGVQDGRTFPYEPLAPVVVQWQGATVSIPVSPEHSRYLPRPVLQRLAEWTMGQCEPQAGATPAAAPCLVAYWGSFAPYHRGHQDTLDKAIAYIRGEYDAYAYLGALVVPLPRRCFKGRKASELPTLFEFRHRAMLAHLQIRALATTFSWIHTPKGTSLQTSSTGASLLSKALPAPCGTPV
jgi:hypothetical protein